MKLKNFIGGDFLEPTLGNYIENMNPATGKVISLLPNSTHEDVQLAVEAATIAKKSWATTSGEDRFKILNKIADLIESKLDELALAETTDTGKPIKFSKAVDIPRAASNFRFFATAAMQFASESHAMGDYAINYTLRQPIGVVGCISPWNLPLYLFTWKIAPALAAGNCVIAKPSELSPTTAYLLGEICNEAGLPKGVLNILHGDGLHTGSAIVAHPDIKAISFTGGTNTGKKIAEVAAPMFKKISLELGGKNPCLIFADCDYEKTISEVSRLAFSNQGQICLCGSRILIEQSIYEKFKTDLIHKVQQLNIGDPLLEATQIGSLISKAHQQKVMNYIQLAKEEGGVILCGGKIPMTTSQSQNNAFIEPTIIENLGPQCRTNQEEIFGPVITIQSFNTDEEAITLANDSNYGLAASVWTNNHNRAMQLTTKLNTGIVWINCWLLRDLRTPFGGMKDSGVGREGGEEAMRFFTEAKNVCIKY